MRQIKFRALFRHLKTGEEIYQYAGLGDKLDRWGYAQIGNWNQYIGLHDINGEEIYENDTVKCWSGKESDILDYREQTGLIKYIAPFWYVGDNNLALSNCEFIEVVSKTSKYE